MLSRACRQMSQTRRAGAPSLIGPRCAGERQQRLLTLAELDNETGSTCFPPSAGATCARSSEGLKPGC